MMLQFINPKVVDTYREAHQALLQELIREALEQAQHVSPASHAIPSEPVKPYLSVKEAAELMRVAPSTIRCFIRNGKLEAQRVGRRVIISREALEKIMQRNSPAQRLH